MRTISKVEVVPVFCEGNIPEIPSEYKEKEIYINKDSTQIGMNCLCGCGDLIILPVNISQEGWQLKVDDGKISLIGSILQYNCKSHYIITKNVANFV